MANEIPLDGLPILDASKLSSPEDDPIVRFSLRLEESRRNWAVLGRDTEGKLVVFEFGTSTFTTLKPSFFHVAAAMSHDVLTIDTSTQGIPLSDIPDDGPDTYP